LPNLCGLCLLATVVLTFTVVIGRRVQRPGSRDPATAVGPPDHVVRPTFAPVTIFGPLLAVIYLGRHHLAFHDSTRIETISQHFDVLVREVEIGARKVSAHLRRLGDRVRQGLAVGSKATDCSG
jgi:hypothetical protein